MYIEASLISALSEKALLERILRENVGHSGFTIIYIILWHNRRREKI
jgi:hypothetical protein